MRLPLSLFPIPCLLVALAALTGAHPGTARADAMEPTAGAVRALSPVFRQPRLTLAGPREQTELPEGNPDQLLPPELLPLDIPDSDELAQGWDGAEGDSLWLREPGARLETEVAFSQALNSLIPDHGEDSPFRLGMGAYGNEQAWAMGWFRRVQGNTLLNFSFSSEPDLTDMAARGGILIHW